MWRERVRKYVEKCVPCIFCENTNPSKQARLEIVHLLRRFSRVEFDVQTITSTTNQENAKAVVMMDLFTTFVRAVPMRNEQAKTITRLLINECILILGPMLQLLSDRGSNLIER